MLTSVINDVYKKIRKDYKLVHAIVKQQLLGQNAGEKYTFLPQHSSNLASHFRKKQQAKSNKYIWFERFHFQKILYLCQLAGITSLIRPGSWCCSDDKF